MMVQEEIQALKDEMRRDMLEEMTLENDLYTDENFAFEHFAEELDIEDAVERIKSFISSMEDYGYEIGYGDVFDVL